MSKGWVGSWWKTKCKHTEVELEAYTRHPDGNRYVTVNCADCSHWFMGYYSAHAPQWVQDGVENFEKAMALDA